MAFKPWIRGTFGIVAFCVAGPVGVVILVQALMSAVWALGIEPEADLDLGPAFIVGLIGFLVPVQLILGIVLGMLTGMEQSLRKRMAVAVLVPFAILILFLLLEPPSAYIAAVNAVVFLSIATTSLACLFADLLVRRLLDGAG